MSWSETQYAIEEITKVTGLPPQNMSKFSVKSETDENGNNKVNISCRAPEDTIINGFLLCSVGGVRILRKEGKASISPEDGVLIANVPYGTDFEYVDENLNNDTTYYYSFFPYSDHGVFNYTDYNKKYVTFGNPDEPPVVQQHYWTFDQDFANLNPYETITYPSGCYNEQYKKMYLRLAEDSETEPAVNTEEYSYGDWRPFLEEFLKNYPYVVHSNGEADYALDPNDYTKKSDGSASDYNNKNYDGGCFAWINKLWMREEYSSDGNSREVQFTNKETEGFTPLGFYNQKQEEVEGLWIPMGYGDIQYRSLIETSDDSVYYGTWSTVPSANNTLFAGVIFHFLRDIMYMLGKSTYLNDSFGMGWGYTYFNYGISPTRNNHVIKNGILPGWYCPSSRTNGDSKAFHSQVINSSKVPLYNPYRVMIRSGSRGDYISPFYNGSVNASGYTKIGSIPESSSSNVVYSSKLVYINEYIGSVPKMDGAGSSSTGLCTASLPVLNNSNYNNRITSQNQDYSWTINTGFSSENFQCLFEASILGCARMIIPPVGYIPFSQ